VPRTGSVHTALSVSQTTRDPEPIISVSFGWLPDRERR
jgi:hypothetical protein